MSVRVSSLVWGRSKAKGHVLLLMLSLADQANDDGYCWPKQATLARRLRLGSDRAVRKAIDGAVAMDELTVIHRTHEGRFIGNAYQIRLDILRGQPDIWDDPQPAAPEPQFPRKETTTGTTVPVPPEPQFRSPPEPQFRTTTVSNNHQLTVKGEGGVFELPSWLPEEAWGDFLAHRKALKAPVNQLSATRLIKTLEKLRTEGNDPVEVIDQSIATGKWTGLFPLKGSGPRSAAQGTARGGEAAMNPYAIKVEPNAEEVDW